MHRATPRPPRLPAIFCALALLGACAAPRARPSGPPAPAAPRLFDLRSAFWVNLHQRLFAETSPPFARLDPQDAAGAFTPDERARWDAALNLYGARFPQRTILATLEPPLSDLHIRLAAQGDRATLAGAGLDPALAATLEAAAGVYRARGWAADDRANRAWIAALDARLARSGAAFAQRLAAAYETRWPARPLVAYVAPRAGMVGAYTLDGDAPLITIASGLPSYQGDAALEMIFHEASHVVGEPVVDAALARACRARGCDPPDQLWHAVLFYTAGDVARRLAPGYVPYAYANGLYARSPSWTRYEAALRDAWQPHLDGRVGLDAAVDALVAALAHPAQGAVAGRGPAAGVLANPP